jgi:hypothetical protein
MVLYYTIPKTKMEGNKKPWNKSVVEIESP